MRLTIEINDELLAEAREAMGSKTERETVEAALRLLVRLKRQASARDLFGTVEWEGDLRADRLDDPEPASR